MHSIRAPELDLERTLFSGQVFGWEKDGEWFCGDLLGDFAKVKYEDRTDAIVFEGTKKEKIAEYFDLKTDYAAVEGKIANIDPSLSPILKKYSGLRILRQDPWQASVSFVVSQNNNIPRIRLILGKLKMKFGKKKTGGKAPFPTPKEIASASMEELMETCLGYRAPYVKSLAKAAANHEIDFENLAKQKYKDAFCKLVSIHGVGPKVADCILLYGLHNTWAFPADVWVRRAMVRHYKRELEEFAKEEKCKAKEPTYEIIRNFARKKFGNLAGYAQQFLFVSEREAHPSKKTW